MPLLDPGRSVFPTDFHGLPFRQLRIDLRTDQIVEGGEARPLGREEYGQVFSMGVCVTDQKIENRPAQKGHAIDRGPDALLLQKVKALRQSRTAFTFVFLFREKPECLAEVFLVKANQTSDLVPAAVIAGDDL